MESEFWACCILILKPHLFWILIAQNKNYCLRRHTIFSDLVSHSIYNWYIYTVPSEAQSTKRRANTSIPNHSKEHQTKCNFHEAVLNNTDCVWTGNAKREQFKLKLQMAGIEVLYCLHTYFVRFWGSLDSKGECLNETGLKFWF